MSAKMSSLPTGFDCPDGLGAGGGRGNDAAGIGVLLSEMPGGRLVGGPPTPGGVAP